MNNTMQILLKQYNPEQFAALELAELEKAKEESRSEILNKYKAEIEEAKEIQKAKDTIKNSDLSMTQKNNAYYELFKLINKLKGVK